MSQDYALWKLKHGRKLSPGLCYLLLCQDADFPEAEGLDADAYRTGLSEAFPFWDDREGGFPLECTFLPNGVLMSVCPSTPDKVLEWFTALAKRDGLVLFDPQTQVVSAEDRRQCEARLAKARKAAERRREDKELPALIARAEAGDPVALVEMGNRYSFGEGVAQDSAKALDCCRRAAEAGSSDGMFNLAAMYRKGEAVERDMAEAIRWYQCAMEGDSVYPPFVLGEIYADGDGIAKDEAKAIEYFKISLEGGHPDARRALRKLGCEL